MALGARIKEAREKRGWEQKKLVELSRVPQANVSALETRDSGTSEDLFALADALRVNPRWLQDGVEPSGLETTAGFQDPTSPKTVIGQVVQCYNLLSQQEKVALYGILYSWTGVQVEDAEAINNR